MPLVAWACLSYAAGLFVAHTAPPVAFVGATTIALVIGIASAPSSVRARSPALAPCALLFAAAAMIGWAAQRDDRRCVHTIITSTAPRATLDARAEAGGVVRARLRAGSCSAPATLLVRRGSARAGEDAAVAGELSLGERGVLVRDATLSDVRTTYTVSRARGAVGRRIDRLFGADAPLVRALVIADMSAIPAEQRDRFARAGLVHMVSVSGLHVAIIALALTLLAGALRLPPVPARIGTLVLLAAYVIGIGAPPPAVRAAIMLGLIVATKLVQRPTSVWAILALGGAAPLVDPAIVVDLGWQLSVAGTVALVAGGALARRMVPREWPHIGRGLATAATVSVVATLVTAPLVAWTFGSIALLGPITNLLADPVMGVLQPALFLALAIPIPAIEHITADAAHLLILAFDTIAARAADVPHAAPSVLPSATAALAGAVASVALVVACLAKRAMPAVLLGLAATAVMTLEPLVTAPRAVTELHMLDVGQGDALALRTRRGHWIVVDAGRSWTGGDAGRSTVVPYIAHRGGAVALFVLSHPHADHVGGAASLFDAMRPARFLDPGYVGTSPPYRAAIAAAQRARIPWQRVRPGDSLVVDEVVLTALAPDSAWASGLADANLASAVVSVRVGTVRILFTGDAEGAEEEWLLAHSPFALRADILKVGHHGSATSTTAPFLAAVRPRLALISVGAQNTYGHPDPEVLSALEAAHAQVVRTDRAGTVIVRTDGTGIEVEARGARWRLPERPPRLLIE